MRSSLDTLPLSGPGSQKLHVSEIRSTVDYDTFCQLCQTLFSSEVMKRKETGITREALDVLCQLATTESDRCLLKYSVCKSLGLSAKKAMKDFGFHNFHEKSDMIMKAVEKAQAIRDAVMKLARVKNRATLESLGYKIPHDSEDSSSDSAESDAEQLLSESDIDVSADQSETDIDSDPESDNPDQWVGIDDLSSESAKEMVAKQWKILRHRARINAAKAIAQAGLLKRTVTKRVSKVLKNYPNIGKDIEDFVSEHKIGADAWRRTGVLTFSYGKHNESSGLKVTYRRIKEHLETKYQTRFSYGTVVQLCVARNKRRISAKRYRGVAKVTCRRARKGFTVKLNPDAHYSSAMYSCLDQLQKQDGTASMMLNRDDAASFRLDTTFTHRQHSGLCLADDVEVTTRTDYVNKYSSTLQVSSYLFLETETTPEVSHGIVKAHHLHEKSPAQHMADLQMLEESSDFKELFGKKVEFIRVDGGADEGPSHAEVQFMWTERHLSRGTECLLVTTRHSGGSYLNKVKLLNGCLAKAHSNLFIPSTIAGPCSDDEQLAKNLHLAIDYYIQRVNGAPCGNGTINLLKGSSSEFAKYARDRRPKLLLFLRCTKKEKLALKQSDPTLYAYFEEVWDVRNHHMVKNLPDQYVFMLVPCRRKGVCPHVKCQADECNLQLKWFPNGPSLEYFPIPIPDPNRPWGGECSQCKGACTGHFLSPDQHLQHYEKQGREGMMVMPPSKILGDAHKKLCAKKMQPNEETIADLSKQTLLSEEDVEMWLQHLDDVHKNRVAGARRAAEKRKSKSNKKAVQKDADADAYCLCGEGEHGLMISCDADNCPLMWYHVDCVGLTEETVPSGSWFCQLCQH